MELQLVQKLEFSMSLSKIPTDQNGMPLRYTGEENFAEFRANFQRYCEDHDLADLFDETLLKSSPKYPEDLINKLDSDQDLTESEGLFGEIVKQSKISWQAELFICLN